MIGYISFDAVTGRYQLKNAEGIVLSKSKSSDYFRYHKERGDNPVLNNISSFVYLNDQALESHEPSIKSAQEPILDDSFGINERFEILKAFVGMVATHVAPSVVITGSGGLGKTFTVLEVLSAHGLTPAGDMQCPQSWPSPPLRDLHSIRSRFSGPGWCAQHASFSRAS